MEPTNSVSEELVDEVHAVGALAGNITIKDELARNKNLNSPSVTELAAEHIRFNNDTETSNSGSRVQSKMERQLASSKLLLPLSDSQQQELFKDSNVHENEDIKLTKFSFGVARESKIEKDLTSRHKLNITSSKAFIVSDDSHSDDEETLRQRKSDFKEKFSKINRGSSTNFIVGGPIHEIPDQEVIRKKLTVLDDTAQRFKSTYRARLDKCWFEAMKTTQPLKYDPSVTMSSSKFNSPPVESRNGGYRVGKALVRDEVEQEAQEAKLKEAFQ